MQNILVPFLQVINIALDLYVWAIIIYVVMSWLVNFNVVNPSNQFVRMIGQTLQQLVEPALNRIRRFLPMFGALDLSPVVLMLGIIFLQLIVNNLIIEIRGM